MQLYFGSVADVKCHSETRKKKDQQNEKKSEGDLLKVVACINIIVSGKYVVWNISVMFLSTCCMRLELPCIKKGRPAVELGK